MRPFDDWPGKPFRLLNEPLRSLIGRYEAGLVREGTHSKATILWMSEDIEGFFYDHPRVKRPEQIQITDVEDWRLAKNETAAPNSVRRALCALKAFYNWLKDEPEYGLLDNPVWVPKPTAKLPRNSPSSVTVSPPQPAPLE